MFQLINMNNVKRGDKVTLRSGEMKTIDRCEDRDEYENVSFDEYETIRHYQIDFVEGGSFLYSDSGCPVNPHDFRMSIVKIGEMSEQEWEDWEEAFNAS